MTPFALRDALPEDEPFLWQMLYYAANMALDGARSPDAAKEDPYLAKFVEGWGGQGDIGVIAYEPGTGRPLGAAWARVLAGAEQSYPSVEGGVPELAIAVLPELIGRGVGGALLARLLELARPRYPAIVLSVREQNPARRLYERHGFVVVEEIVNRVGGRSFVMLARL